MLLHADDPNSTTLNNVSAMVKKATIVVSKDAAAVQQQELGQQGKAQSTELHCYAEATTLSADVVPI